MLSSSQLELFKIYEEKILKSFLTLAIFPFFLMAIKNATQNIRKFGAACTIATIFIIFTTNVAPAKTITLVKEYIYQASEIDSKVSCRAIALEQAKRLLLEDLGTYLESETEIKEFKLTKDRITTLTAGTVQTEIIEEKWDGKTYYLKAKITADPNEVVKSIDTLRKDRQRSKELEETRKRAEDALKETQRLRNEIKDVKRDKEKQEEYKKAIDKLNANDWSEKGIRFFIMGDLEETINAFNKVIDLDPKIAAAYLVSFHPETLIS